ncbi:MAG: CHRD domain-containing protein [Phycisphaerae bacterium]
MTTYRNTQPEIRRIGAFTATAISVIFLSLPTAIGHELVFESPMSGPAEAPPNNSPGTGFVRITIDLDLVTMHIEADFQDLMGTVTAAHIHGLTAMPNAGTAGVAIVAPSLPGFPTGVMAGNYDHTLDLTLASSYNAAFIAASGGTVSDALNAVINGMQAERMYFNIHTTSFGGGEIRGFPALVPLLLGDMNCDGVVSVADIGGFVLALTDAVGYAAQFPKCDINAADINGDELITVSDIGGFVALLVGG